MSGNISPNACLLPPLTGSFDIQNSTSETALKKCFPLLRKYLNCGAIVPYLVKYELITNGEHERLMLYTLTNGDRVDLIFQWLPSKPNFMKKFLACLRESAKEETVPAHEEIARKLEKEISRTRSGQWNYSQNFNTPES